MLEGLKNIYNIYSFTNTTETRPDSQGNFFTRISNWFTEENNDTNLAAEIQRIEKTTNIQTPVENPINTSLPTNIQTPVKNPVNTSLPTNMQTPVNTELPTDTQTPIEILVNSKVSPLQKFTENFQNLAKTDKEIRENIEKMANPEVVKEWKEDAIELAKNIPELGEPTNYGENFYMYLLVTLGIGVTIYLIYKYITYKNSSIMMITNNLEENLKNVDILEQEISELKEDINILIDQQKNELEKNIQVLGQEISELKEDIDILMEQQKNLIVKLNTLENGMQPLIINSQETKWLIMGIFIISMSTLIIFLIKNDKSNKERNL